MMEEYDKPRLTTLERERFIRDLPSGTVSPSEKLILYTLHSRSDRFGNCHPSQSTIRKDSGLSVRAIQYGLQRLAEIGLVARSRRYKRSTVYSLTFETYARKIVSISTAPPAARSHILN